MRSLVLTEFSRFRHRRAIMLVLALAVLVPVVMWGSIVWSGRPVTEADRQHAMAQQQADQRETVEMCVASPADWDIDTTLSAEEITKACEQANTYDIDGWMVRQELDLAQHARADGSAFGLVTVLGMLMFVAGATFAGADWASGSMSNQLLMEPRRGRVWAAKAGVVGAVGVVVPLLLVSLFWAGLILMAKVWDRPPVPGIAEQLVWLNLRGVALTGVAAVLGFAVAMWLRSSASAITVALVLGLGSEIVLRMLPIDDPEPWTLVLNLQAWVENGANYWPQNCWAGCGENGSRYGIGGAALYLGVLAALLVLVSVRSFRRRDVP